MYQCYTGLSVPEGDKMSDKRATYNKLVYKNGNYHTKEEIADKAEVLANETLKLAKMCREKTDEDLKEYQLSQVEQLAREVLAAGMVA